MPQRWIFFLPEYWGELWTLTVPISGKNVSNVEGSMRAKSGF
jgi:hypothetical protein